MYKIITANGISFVDPEGSFTLSKTDDINEYKGEDGHIIVEIIRQNVISASVSYKSEIYQRLSVIWLFSFKMSKNNRLIHVKSLNLQ